jgi:hypothetical protein
MMHELLVEIRCFSIHHPLPHTLKGDKNMSMLSALKKVAEQNQNKTIDPLSYNR